MELQIDRFSRQNGGTRAIYKKSRQGLNEDALQNGGNAGLWFERIGEDWLISRIVTRNGQHETVYEQKADKSKWLGKFHNKTFGDGQALQAYAKRLRRLALSRGGRTARFAELKAINRFVTGMGIENPVENGFTWHPTLGTPYIPGSSLKGMVQAFARVWAEQVGQPSLETPLGAGERAAWRIFGQAPRGAGADENDEEEDNERGSVIFLDAVPVKPVKLSMGIMTPHYSDYYKGKGFPDDRKSPTPLPFLTVAPGAVFQFAVMPADSFIRAAPGFQDEDGDALDLAREECARAMAWLEQALTYIGAGAKTKSGFGRFRKSTT